MSTLNEASDWRALSERYRQLSDDELINLSRESSELTAIAKQTLAQEVSRRRLTIEPDPPASEPTSDEPDADDSDSAEADDDPYTEDRELVELCTVWSRADAAQIASILQIAGFPFFMGPEKATSADAVTSNFADGVSVRVMNIGFPYARQFLERYNPSDEPADVKAVEADYNAAVHCPKCHSDDITFDHLVAAASNSNAPSKFQWTCNACGNGWTDDGVEA